MTEKIRVHQRKRIKEDDGENPDRFPPHCLCHSYDRIFDLMEKLEWDEA